MNVYIMVKWKQLKAVGVWNTYVELFLISMEREFTSLKDNPDFIRILDDANAYVDQFGKSVVKNRKDDLNGK